MTLLGGLGLAYAAYAAAVYSMQRSILFPGRSLVAPDGVAERIPGLEVEWLEVGTDRVETWWLPASEGAPRPAPAVVFAHGNGELIDHWPSLMKPYQELGLGVLLVEYPGYGRSTGAPSEASITAALVAAYDRLVARPDVDPGRIVLHGRSLGGAALSLLSERRASAAMILQSSFTSVRAFAAGMGLPGVIVKDPFDAEAAVAAYPGPLLILHGERDGIVPPRHAHRLLDVAAQGQLVTYGAGHNDFPPDWRAYWSDLAAFLASAGIVPG